MELAKHISENLRTQYPNDSFVACKSDNAAFGHGLPTSIICDMHGATVSRLPFSSAKAIDDSALKSLLHRVMLESKSMSTSVDRAEHISDQICKMLPGHYNTVFVTPVSSNDRPVVYGPHKGLAYFWEPEFGEHVTIVLH